MFTSSNPGDSLRYFTSRDIKQAVSIGTACFSNPPDKKYFQEFLDREDAIGWVLERNGNIIAYCFIQTTERAINIIQLAVDPEYHRTLAGESIIKFLKEKLRMGGRQFITAFLHDGSLPGLMFMRWMGFVSVDDIFGNKPGEEQVLMVFPAPAGSWRKNRIAQYYTSDGKSDL